MTNLRAKGLTRREALELLGAASALVTAGCSGDTPTSPSATTSTTATTVIDTGGPSSGTTSCAVSPSETVGPYRSLGDYLRRNITDGKPGVPLALTISVLNAASGCVPVANASVEVWQCDHQGIYGEYGEGRGQTFLRGIQLTDAQGQVTFETVYPGWLVPGPRHPHPRGSDDWRPLGEGHADRVSRERYRCLCRQGAEHHEQLRDGIFADSLSQEMIALAGDTSSGFRGTFTVGVSA